MKRDFPLKIKEHAEKYIQRQMNKHHAIISREEQVSEFWCVNDIYASAGSLHMLISNPTKYLRQFQNTGRWPRMKQRMDEASDLYE